MEWFSFNSLQALLKLIKEETSKFFIPKVGKVEIDNSLTVPSVEIINNTTDYTSEFNFKFPPTGSGGTPFMMVDALPTTDIVDNAPYALKQPDGNYLGYYHANNEWHPLGRDFECVDTLPTAPDIDETKLYFERQDDGNFKSYIMDNGTWRLVGGSDNKTLPTAMYAFEIRNDKHLWITTNDETITDDFSVNADGHLIVEI